MSEAQLFYGVVFKNDTPTGVHETFENHQASGGIGYEVFDSCMIIEEITTRCAKLAGVTDFIITEMDRGDVLSIDYCGYRCSQVTVSVGSSRQVVEYYSMRLDPSALVVDPLWVLMLEAWCDLVGVDKARIGWHLAACLSE